MFRHTLAKYITTQMKSCFYYTHTLRAVHCLFYFWVARDMMCSWKAFINLYIQCVSSISTINKFRTVKLSSSWKESIKTAVLSVCNIPRSFFVYRSKKSCHSVCPVIWDLFIISLLRGKHRTIYFIIRDFSITAITKLIYIPGQRREICVFKFLHSLNFRGRKETLEYQM